MCRGIFNSSWKPEIIDSLYEICAASAGGQHTLFLTLNGEVYSCGRTSLGQCGYGYNGSERFPHGQGTPVLVPELIRLRVTQIAVGKYHSLALSLGDVYSFGDNGQGQLGRGRLYDVVLRRTYNRYRLGEEPWNNHSYPCEKINTEFKISSIAAAGNKSYYMQEGETLYKNLKEIAVCKTCLIPTHY
jgi:alpha-tubulin suppressor-like RCC1 family protein